ncbi:protein SLOW GREEN 1, chloroplastic [Cucurbita moschata]|uniref:Protein SLOW GREEN 1, chloroplastic n=1 Tax=Cucurbita moschata TaxID=3662 RepID=A0A6J1GYL7_CUCMO|nr:protein SLOW GREEN 1, chloroplastic [Cucurbita moschata]XP_022956918.1 protein SLOW GREEN 1, chloroplastic [Cucurbita moschata]
MSFTFASMSSPSSSSLSSIFISSKSKPVPPPNLRFAAPISRTSVSVHRFRVRASSVPVSRNHPVVQCFKNYARAAILIGAAATMVGKFSHLPARAESPVVVEEEASRIEEEQRIVEDSDQDGQQSSPLNDFLESNSEAVEALKSLLQQKLENSEDEEALKILNQLVSAQSSVTEWKFLKARLLGEMGKTENAREVFEEILAENPLSFEALFENALLMDRCGEGEAVLLRLEQALRIAENEKKAKEARDVRLIMAQIQFLQKNVEGALTSYKELIKEDPSDFRPYFCQGMIYSLLDKNEEARQQFSKYRELSPKKFEVDGYLRTPLSRMKIFGSDEN